jgi:hypothetical protein
MEYSSIPNFETKVHTLTPIKLYSCIHAVASNLSSCILTQLL